MKRPTIVCLCGSTRFSEEYQTANIAETLAGHIVLTIGCDMRSDGDLFAAMSKNVRDEIKRKLDELHLRKIDLADEILVLNPGGYVGESTAREIAYAAKHGKRIRYYMAEAGTAETGQGEGE
jgi:dihydropteroate synthase